MPLVAILGMARAKRADMDNASATKIKRFENLIKRAKKIVAYSLGNNFIGEDMTPEAARRVFGMFDPTIKPQQGTKVTLRCHSNCWYEITV